VRLELDPVEALIAGRDNVEELLRPGLFEWGLLRADGGGEVVPVATAIEVGEGDLQRAEAAEIRQGLLPIEVRFISSQDWNQENQFAGSSRLGLILLALLALLLAAEQALAYWASYHASGPATGAAGTGVSGAGHAAAGGAQFGLAATSHAGGQSG
jgi:hypothetical protein